MKNQLTKTIALIIFLTASAVGQSTAFTYQGKLTEGGTPASGHYDLSFRLFDSVSGGTEVGTVIIREDVQVSGGIFSAQLDFGASPFLANTGNFLEIAVRPGSSTGAFTLLLPRQPITSSPYAVQTLRAETAATADNATNLGGVTASQYVQTNDPRLSDERSPTAGSANYIRNGTGLQLSSNFNISGNGIVGGTLSGDVIDAASRFHVGGEPLIGNPAGFNSNLFVGRFTPSTFAAGGNALFGDYAGHRITSGTNNSFFGQGIGNTQGTGTFTTMGSFNSFFGHRTGENNSTGTSNSFFGTGSGFFTTIGSENTLLGHDAGRENALGSYNTALGSFADTTFGNLNFATAIGAHSRVSSSDTIVIGKASGVYDGLTRPSDLVQIPGNLSVLGVLNGNGSMLTNLNAVDLSTNQTGIAGNKSFTGSIRIGTDGAPTNRLEIVDSGNTGLRVQNNASGGSVASFGGLGKFSIDAPSFPGGRFTVLENGNVGLGNSNPSSRLVVEGSTVLGGTAAINGDTTINLGSLTVNGGNLNVAAASGNTNMFLRATGQARGINFGVAGNVDADPTLTITQFDGTTHRHRISILSDGRIQMGFSDPAATSSVFIGGTLGVFSMLGGGTTQVCRGGGATQMLLQCSSSLRYKANVHTFSPGLDLINRLRPVTFDWKVNGQSDMGLVAEEVAEVEPLLVTYYEGKVEGVKYDRVGVIAVNAIKEQQQQIEQQKFEIEELRRTVAALREALCSSTPSIQICKPQEHKK